MVPRRISPESLPPIDGGTRQTPALGSVPRIQNGNLGMKNCDPRVFDMSDVLDRRRKSGQLYLEFLRASTMSAGVYTLAAETPDPQLPHTEDEIYYVLSGRGHIRVGDEDFEVKRDSLIYVAAGEEHRFHWITEDLRLLVVFAPPRGSIES